MPLPTPSGTLYYPSLVRPLVLKGGLGAPVCTPGSPLKFHIYCKEWIPITQTLIKLLILISRSSWIAVALGSLFSVLGNSSNSGRTNRAHWTDALMSLYIISPSQPRINLQSSNSPINLFPVLRWCVHTCFVVLIDAWGEGISKADVPGYHGYLYE